jgi:hypothetical protein
VVAVATTRKAVGGRTRASPRRRVCCAASQSGAEFPALAVSLSVLGVQHLHPRRVTVASLLNNFGAMGDLDGSALVRWLNDRTWDRGSWDHPPSHRAFTNLALALDSAEGAVAKCEQLFAAAG